MYRRNKPTRDVGRTQEKLVSHEPKASDLQAISIHILSTTLNSSFHYPSLLYKTAPTHVNKSLPNPDVCQDVCQEIKSENSQKDV